MEEGCVTCRSEGERGKSVSLPPYTRGAPCCSRTSGLFTRGMRPDSCNILQTQALSARGNLHYSTGRPIPPKCRSSSFVGLLNSRVPENICQRDMTPESLFGVGSRARTRYDRFPGSFFIATFDAGACREKSMWIEIRKHFIKWQLLMLLTLQRSRENLKRNRSRAVQIALHIIYAVNIKQINIFLFYISAFIVIPIVTEIYYFNNFFFFLQ